MLNKQSASSKIDWRIINGMRGLAALYVVIHHSRHRLFTDAMDYARLVNPKENWSWWEWLNILFLQHANLGVEFVILFFVLSGFSIAHSLNHKPDIKGFYFRRLIRLYPTYIIGLLWALAVYLLIRYACPDVFYNPTETLQPFQFYFNHFTHLPNIIKTLLYLPSNNSLIIQYWSLPLEVIFYLLAPVIIIKLRWYAIATIALYLIGWGIYGVDNHDIRNSALPFQFTFDYGIYFLIGIAFYKFKNQITNAFKLNKAVVFLILFALFETLVILKSYVWSTNGTRATGLMMVLFSFIMLFGFLKNNIHITWLEKIGVYSYTLYVTHIASIYVINIISYKIGTHFHLITNLYLWYLGVISSIVFAYLLYWIAEYPSTKYLEQLRAKR